MSYDHLHLPILPWSCCRVDFPMQCFHDPLQQIQSQHVWADQPNLVLESINTVGCLDILREPTENALIGFIIITVFIITVQVRIMFIFYFYNIWKTANKSIIAAGNLVHMSF